MLTPSRKIKCVSRYIYAYTDWILHKVYMYGHITQYTKIFNFYVSVKNKIFQKIPKISWEKTN